VCNWCDEHNSEDDEEPVGKIDSNHKEGASWRDTEDGKRHETRWYDTGEGSSSRTSRDIDKDGNETDEHTTVQK
jgi:hypothetical protein